MWASVFKRSRERKVPVVVQYTETRSVKLTLQALYNLLDRQYPHVLIEDLSAVPVTTQVPVLSSSESWTSLQDTVQSLVQRLEETSDYVVSLGDALERHERANEKLSQMLANEHIGRMGQTEALRQRLGPMHENLVKQSISIAYGWEWGKAYVITEFADAMLFVSNGLGKSSKQRELGEKKLLERLCRKSNEDFDGKISMSTNTTYFQNVFLQVSLKPRLLLTATRRQRTEEWRYGRTSP